MFRGVGRIDKTNKVNNGRRNTKYKNLAQWGAFTVKSRPNFNASVEENERFL